MGLTQEQAGELVEKAARIAHAREWSDTLSWERENSKHYWLDEARDVLAAILPDIVEACAKVPEEIADGLGKYKLVVGNERKDACNWLQEAARRIRALASEKGTTP